MCVCISLPTSLSSLHPLSHSNFLLPSLRRVSLEETREIVTYLLLFSLSGTRSSRKLQLGTVTHLLLPLQVGCLRMFPLSVLFPSIHTHTHSLSLCHSPYPHSAIKKVRSIHGETAVTDASDIRRRTRGFFYPRSYDRSRM